MAAGAETLAIPVDMHPTWVAITSSGDRVYVATEDGHGAPGSGGVAVIDSQAKNVVATVSLDSRPSGLVIAPDGRHAYVASFSHGHGVVSVIDTGTNQVVETVAVSGRGGGPSGVAITPDSRQVYVATDQEVDMPEGQGKVTVIDTATNSILMTIRGNPFPSAPVVKPDGKFVYVLDHDGNPQVIDTATHQFAFPFPVSGVDNHERMAFTPDGLHAYIVGDTTDFVDVLDVTTHHLMTLVDVVGGNSTDVASTPDGRLICVTQRPGKSSDFRPLRLIDTATQQLIEFPLTWTGSANGIAIAPDSSTAYVSDRNSSAVRVVPLPPRT